MTKNQVEGKVIHPFEVFNIRDLAERLEVSEGTIRNLMIDGLQCRKMKSITYFTGQNVLNYFNQTTDYYAPELVDKVYKTTGVQLTRKRA